MLKVSYAGCPGLYSDFDEIRSWNVCRSQKSQKKIHKKPLFWRSRSSKVIASDANQKPVYDFLLVIMVTQALSRTVSEIQRLIGWKSQIFPTPLSFSALAGVTPFEFMEKLYGSWN